MTSPPRTNSANRCEPSRYIYVSGISNPRPLTELRYWFSRGHYIYDEMRCPVVPASVAGHGPDRLSTSMSAEHPVWEDTLLAGNSIFEHESALIKQVAEIEDIEEAMVLTEEEKRVAAEEEKRLDAKERRKRDIRAKTWTGSRGKYGNASGAKPHAFQGKVGGVSMKLVGPGGSVMPVQVTAGYRPPIPQSFPFEKLDQFGMGPVGVQQNQHYPPDIVSKEFSAQTNPVPTPSPTAFGLDQMVTPAPGFVQPVLYPSKSVATTFDDVVRSMERQILGIVDTPRPPPAQAQYVHGGTTSWWAQPAATPTMSALSPRAAEFVPTGIVSPEGLRNFAMPITGAFEACAPVHPAVPPPASPQCTNMTGHHRRKKSSLNPAAGVFCPGAVVPVEDSSGESSGGSSGESEGNVEKS